MSKATTPIMATATTKRRIQRDVLRTYRFLSLFFGAAFLITALVWTLQSDTTLAQFLTTQLLYHSFVVALAMVLLAFRNLYPSLWNTQREAAVLVASYALAVMATIASVGYQPSLSFALAWSLLCFIIVSIYSTYTLIGRNFVASSLSLMLFGMLWTMRYVFTIPVSTLTRTLLLSTAPLALILIPSALV